MTTLASSDNILHNTLPQSHLEESEDELLLSPNKKTTTKRSASPSVLSQTRHLKRLKHNSTSINHTRNASDPTHTSEHIPSRTRSKTPSTYRKPLSWSAPDDDSSTSPSTKRRAASVPLNTPAIRIDLNNPPPSPWKTASPSKDQFRVRPVPESIEKSSNQPSITIPNIPEPILPQPSIDSLSDLDLPSMTPSTPAPLPRSALAIPLSPLTPLPETPLPPRQTRLHIVENSWATDVAQNTIIEEPAPSDSATTVPPKSRLPRSTASSSQIPQPSRKPPPLLRDMGPPPLPHNIAPTADKPRNAFSTLMDGARKAKDITRLTKGKTKAVPLVDSTITVFGKKSVAKTIPEKSIRPVAKLSIKARMRPNLKPKPQPSKPRSRSSSEDEDDAGTSRFPPLTHARDSPPPRPPLLPSPESSGMTPTLNGDVVMDHVEEPRIPLLALSPKPPGSPPPSMMVLEMATKTPPTDVVMEDAEEPLPITPAKSPKTLATAPNSPEPLKAASPPALEIKDVLSNDLTDVPHETGSITPLPPPLQGPMDVQLALVVSEAPPPRRLSARQKQKAKAAHNGELESTSQTHSHLVKVAVPPSPTAVDRSSKRSKKKATTEINDGRLSSSSLSDVPTDTEETAALDLGSPMKNGATKQLQSPYGLKARTPSRLRVPSKISSDASPKKLARSASMFVKKPHDNSNPTSLSTLSNALEKLRMPAPERPNTSLGFSRDTSHVSDNDDSSQLHTSTILSRSSSFGLSSTTSSSSTKPSDAKATRPPGQQSLTSFLFGAKSSKGPNAATGSSRIMRAGGPRIFAGTTLGSGRGSRLTQKASRKTSLPSVLASPLKGGQNDFDAGEEAIDIPDERVDNPDQDVFATTTASEPNSEEQKVEKGKGKEKPTDPSRRVSLAAQALSQSLSAIPTKNPKTTLMGPPATPPRRNKPRRSAGGSSPAQASEHGSSPASSEISSGRAYNTRSGGVSKLAISQLPKDASPQEEVTNPAVEAIKVLKDCVIFVDVKTDAGDEAGSLFVEMLKGVGARILTRVGQTCTHIVFKNGMASTLSRYRLLRGDKPFVVGIGWVVECVEQRKHVEETEFLVDLDEMNVAGTNKRRRSMLPKLISRDLMDSVPDHEEEKKQGSPSHALDEGSTSIISDEGLPPLEKARRRKMLTTK